MEFKEYQLITKSIGRTKPTKICNISSVRKNTHYSCGSKTLLRLKVKNVEIQKLFNMVFFLADFL